MLKLLLDGLQCEEDYHLYQRRRVFTHIMALFDSPLVSQEGKVRTHICIVHLQFASTKSHDNFIHNYVILVSRLFHSSSLFYFYVYVQLSMQTQESLGMKPEA